MSSLCILSFERLTKKCIIDLGTVSFTFFRTVLKYDSRSCSFAISQGKSILRAYKCGVILLLICDRGGDLNSCWDLKIISYI